MPKPRTQESNLPPEFKGQFRDKEKASAAGKIGGRVRGEHIQLAAKKRELYKRDPVFKLLLDYFKTEDPKEALDFFRERFGNMIIEIDKARAEGKQTFYMEERLVKSLLELHKLRFGTTQRNVNVNIELSARQAEDRMREFLKDNNFLIDTEGRLIEKNEEEKDGETKR